MDSTIIKSQLLTVTRLASDFCVALENARQYEKNEFIALIAGLLPRIYAEFSDLSVDENIIDPDFGYMQSYVDEDFYESIRRNVGMLLGPDDTFLETFEEDMKYSDTPIAASVSECLADIFQPLYNFLSRVKESEGDLSVEAYADCREDFGAYWAQTLCNVMRPLNHLRFNPTND